MQTVPRTSTPNKFGFLDSESVPLGGLLDRFPRFSLLAKLPDSAQADQWDKVIEHQLLVWERDPESLADEGIELPAKSTVSLALGLARAIRNVSPPPTRVVPDADGGIVFEREEQNVLQTIRVNPDGTIEYCRFREARLIDRFQCDLTARVTP